MSWNQTINTFLGRGNPGNNGNAPVAGPCGNATPMWTTPGRGTRGILRVTMPSVPVLKSGENSPSSGALPDSNAPQESQLG